MNHRISFGISDEDFIRGSVPMTKEEVRVITLGKLKLEKDSVVLDIGAGTGSISIEAALLVPNGKVYAVEVNSQAIDLIRKNQTKFDVSNMDIIEGLAPQVLKDIDTVDRIMVGGSKGNISAIIDWGNKHLSKDGIIVANFISIENTSDFIKELKENNYKYDLTQVSISKGKQLGGLTMLNGMNPIFIVRATR